MIFSDAPVVSVSHVNIYQNEKNILEDVSFEIQKGEFVYLIGRTGSGKTSLLKTLYADLRLKSGQVKVADFSLHNIKKSQIPFLRRKVGIVFQDFQLLYDRTVSDNLVFVMKASGWEDTQKIKQREQEVLHEVGLGNVGNKYPHQLSGGEQQRVVIARALLNEPSILFADEPTGNLDPYVSESIFNLFIDINNRGTAIFMATHNYQIIKKYAFRVLQCEGKTLKDSHKEPIDMFFF
ncbi:MAG: ATP-binding cassette domain-containing protein [Chitinophagaceae bacterium]|nr:ATP-binding cassette domain-containing protein [Chitinophagaceae bacterium]